VILADHELPFVVAAYLFTGRFNPEREFEAHPMVVVTEVGSQIHAAKAENGNALAGQLHAVETYERDEVIGTPEEWETYRQQFDSIINEAVRKEIIPSSRYVNRFFKRLDEIGKPSVDNKGALWLEVSVGDESSKVGVSASNILTQGSDSRLAFTLLLARIDHVLKSPKHSRETMVEFQKDWNLMQEARLETNARDSRSLSAFMSR
jgi:hypothetical protein